MYKQPNQNRHSVFKYACIQQPLEMLKTGSFKSFIVTYALWYSFSGLWLQKQLFVTPKNRCLNNKTGWIV